MNSEESMDIEMKTMYNQANANLGPAGKRFVTAFFEILGKSIGAAVVKREITGLLQETFTSPEWPKDVVTNVLIVVILRAPVVFRLFLIHSRELSFLILVCLQMIKTIIDQGYIHLTDIPRCLYAMTFKHACPAAFKPVLRILGVTCKFVICLVCFFVLCALWNTGPALLSDVDLMNRFIKNHPNMMNKVVANDIPVEVRPFILETMGLHMVPSLWAPGVDILRKETVPIEVVNVFFRAALRCVHPINILAYLATVDISTSRYR